MKADQYFRLNWSVAVPLLALLLGLSMTYHVFHTAQIEYEQKTRAYFDFREREVLNLINQRMRTYESVLRGATGLFAASISVERNEFKEYVSHLNLVKEFPGIQGVGFSLIIPTAKKNQHIKTVRQEGFPEYAIRPDGQRDFYTSIIFLEPFSARNLRAFGYDMFTEEVRRVAMQKAIDTGHVTVSAKVRLVQETGAQEQAGFLMYLPIYRNGSSNDALTARRQNALGWVYAPFRMNDLMQGLYGEHATDLDIHIYDGAEISPQALMYDSNVTVPHSAQLNSTNQIQIVDHIWTVQIRALPLLESRVDVKYHNIIVVTGGGLSVLLSLLLWFLMTVRKRAIMAASDMNQELIIERQRLNSILEGTHVGTWEWDVQTGEVFFNQEWASIIGYELSELAPTSIETWFKFVHPEDGKLSATLLEKHFSGELAYYECEARMRHKDGRWIWVLDRGKVVTWTPDGKPLLMAGTHQEITERKRIENEVKIAATVFESQVGMLVTDADTTILRVNRAFTEITGYSADEAIGQTPRLLKSGRQDKSFYAAMWASLNNTGK